MTDRIHEFLRNRREGRALPRRRPRRRARQLQRLRQGAAGHARVLCRQGQSRSARCSICWRGSARASTRPPSSRSSRCWPPARAPDRISFGNTIKKERDIARAYALGVRLFAVDCEAEVEKIARAAPGAKVFCRILCDGAGAEWPLSRKFGCAPEMAPRVLEHAHRLGLVAYGVSFHVGSQQRNPRMWDGALKASAAIFRELAERGIQSADGQSRRRLPDQISEGRAGGESLCASDLPRAAQAFRQPHPRDDHRAGTRHGRQCRRHRGGSRADLEEVGRRQGELGLSRHRQVQWTRRDDGRDDPLSDPHRCSTATRASLA